MFYTMKSRFYSNNEMFANTTELWFFQLMNMYSLHRRLEQTNISVYALHPGIIDTPILRSFQGISGTYNFGIKMAKLTGKFKVSIFLCRQ